MKNIQNGTLNLNNLNETVELFGWVSKKRNLGGLVFIDLRDRSGIIQLVIRPEDAFYEEASSVKNEYVLRVKGTVTERESKNMSIPTGEIEVIVSEFEVINTSIDLPFEVKNDSTALEDTRLKYRYLDLRREYYQNILKLRHKIALSTRNYFDENGFLEIETPILCKSTPEGARDYLVPSRVNKGKFYALPQSPQIFKQLLMVGGCEIYFQIAKCFRDEDLRADRQPEFTQIDVEMRFVNEEDVMTMGEGLVARIFKDVKGIDIELPLQRMKYVDAMEYYGSDKPDLRFDMKINNVTSIFEKNESALFKGIFENDGIINAVVAKNAADKFSRKDIDKLTDLVKTYKANGLMYLKFESEVSGSIAKLLSEEELNELRKTLNVEENDIVFLVGGKYEIVKTSLGSLRCRLARILDLIKPGDYKMLWVTDFPSFEYSEEENRYVACHHPFTSPKDEDVDKLINDKANCYSKAYDIVINGYEAGGGSIRIHNQDVQSKMFEALGFTEEEARSKFGFFVDALKYGTPPHGGMAFGLDRLVMLVCETENIRDVIAFPKTASASCLMSEAPNVVDEKQLKELHIKLDLGKEEE